MMLTTFRKESELSSAHILVIVDRIKTRIQYDEKLGYFENHAHAAKQVARTMGWQLLAFGDHPKGYVFTNAKMMISL
jgi:hypothetical protein